MANVNECGIAAKQSSTCTQKCRTCQREGIPILPLRYAVIPKDKAKGRALMGAGVKAGGKDVFGQLGAGLKDKKLTEHAYSVRVLRQGFLYVFLEKTQVWQAYGVKPSGLLSQFTDPYNPPADIQKEMSTECYQANDNVPAAFINIPDISKTPKIWVAYSSIPWTKAVFDQYATKAALRKQRMTPLDLSTFKSAPMGQPHAFEVDEGLNTLVHWVEEYASTPAEFAKRKWASAYGFYDRSSSLQKIAAYVKKSKTEKQLPVAALVLHDSAGILTELNVARQKKLAVQQKWQADNAWKKLSVDAIKGLRESMYQKELAATGGKTHKVSFPHSEYANLIRSGDIPKTAPYEVNPSSAVVTLTPAQQAKVNVKPSYKRIEGHYNETKRAAFEKEYETTLGRLQKLVNTFDEDYSLWLPPKSSLADFPDLNVVFTHDFDENNSSCALDYIKQISYCIAGGPMSSASLPWFTHCLMLKPNDPKQLLLRPLIGGQKNLLEWLATDKKDKIYDLIKGFHGAEDSKNRKWLTVANAAIASPYIAAIGATAMIMEKNGTLNKEVRQALNQTVGVALAAWERVEVSLVKISNVTLGALHKALQNAQFNRLDNQAIRETSGPGSAGARGPARFNLPSKIAGKTTEIMLWTTERMDKLLERLPNKSISAALSTTSAMIAPHAENLQRSIKALSQKMAASDSVELITKMVKHTDTMMGSKAGLLAAGSLYFQGVSITSTLASISETSGEQRTDALLGLGSSLLGTIGIGFEIKVEWSKSVAQAKNLAFDEAYLAKLGKRAAGLGALSSAVDAVQSVIIAQRRKAEGDVDAQYLYYGAAVAFAGCALAGGTVALGFAESTLLGPLLGMGPAGWGVLLLAAGVLLTFAALNAEDSDAEKWIARDPFWSSGITGRKDAKFRDWQEQAEALNLLAHGISAKLEWSDTWFNLKSDTIEIKVTVPHSTPTEAWRYRLTVITASNNKPLEIYNRNAGNIEAFPSMYKPRQAELRPFDPNAKGVLIEGRDYKLQDINIEVKDGQINISHSFDLNPDAFTAAKLEFEYYPDSSNPYDKAAITLTAKDNE